MEEAVVYQYGITDHSNLASVAQVIFTLPVGDQLELMEKMMNRLKEQNLKSNAAEFNWDEFYHILQSLKQKVTSVNNWPDGFFEKTFGSLKNDPIERPPRATFQFERIYFNVFIGYESVYQILKRPISINWRKKVNQSDRMICKLPLLHYVINSLWLFIIPENLAGSRIFPLKIGNYKFYELSDPLRHENLI
jgi:hypothetical protein